MEVKDIQPNTSFDVLKLKIVEIYKPVEFATFSGYGRVANAKARDKSGEINLTLWGDEIDKVHIGDTVTIENGWARRYMGKLQVSTGRFGRLKIDREE